jgi:hypothetical protein
VLELGCSNGKAIFNCHRFGHIKFTDCRVCFSLGLFRL